MQARVIGCRSEACAIRFSQPAARSANGSASIPMFSGSRRSRKAERSASGPDPPVRRRTAHPTRASAPVSSCTPDKRMEIQSASRSGPIRSPTSQLRSAASISASLCFHPSGPRFSRSSNAPIRPATRARRAALVASTCRQSPMAAVSRGSDRGLCGRSSGSSSIGLGKNHRSSSDAFSTSFTSMWLCCTNPLRDSSCESSVIAWADEQSAQTHVQDAELARV